MGDAGSARLLSQERTAWNSSLGTVKVTARAVPSEEPHPYDFANEYRRWARRRRRELAALDHQFAAQAEKPSAARNPADVTADRDTLRRILEVATPEARVICGLILQGRTRLEIGQAIGGLSERAVEGHMRRLRTAVRRMAGTGEIAVPPGWAAATGATA